MSNGKSSIGKLEQIPINLSEIIGVRIKPQKQQRVI
jgi:hypothetical protein